MFTFTGPNSGSIYRQRKLFLQVKRIKKGTEKNSNAASYKRPHFPYVSCRSSEIYSGNIYIYIFFIKIGLFEKRAPDRFAIDCIYSIDENIFQILDHTLYLLNSWLLAG